MLNLRNSRLRQWLLSEDRGEICRRIDPENREAASRDKRVSISMEEWSKHVGSQREKRRKMDGIRSSGMQRIRRSEHEMSNRMRYRKSRAASHDKGFNHTYGICSEIPG
ncbi:hypothetical protein PRIPAC_90321 [Pristionchus pacificus]|uniref:Uncharacterized protein n=1 Tax=Pristionchus pacificus TaxID=54126 RepID=A0A2A6B7B2_PRIPA|nr:hypothetical protein PRIPAC_90321 [Pristionchus pacificus]|eukprot:PDM61757.1 hypothetical protein PRIPAC_51199 [Pristionchus pacificus]